MGHPVHAVHQIIPVLTTADATSVHTIEVRRLLQDLGYESEIYVGDADGPAAGLAHHHRDLPGGPGVVLLYQFAIGSVLGDVVRDRTEPLGINSHNSTPAEYYEPWEPAIAHGLAWGRRQLAELEPRTRLAITVSQFNADDLAVHGYRRIQVAPVLVDIAAGVGEIDPVAADRIARDPDGPRWLFVGRIAPNKAQHDIVRAFAAYRRLFAPTARLDLVGGPTSERYDAAVRRLAVVLGVADAVTFTGRVTPGELAARYAAADVLVCLSEHEGFCVPLLEAMHHRVPIVAYGASAVPETLAGAGIVLDDKDPITVATAAARVVDDPRVRVALVAAGQARLGELSLERGRAAMTVALEELVARASE
jgi:L-malate glycosyltransferase